MNPKTTLQELLLKPDPADPKPNVIEKATIRMDRETFFISP